ncbi:aldo/keto reductase [candidate division KSB1 bacterium]|nr:aldo/keto reductase [candidate division KSB1 bacterium]
MKITDVRGSVKLHNGVEIPYLGLGVFQAKDGKEVIQAVRDALDIGYRLIDTAAIYGNESGVGKAVNDHSIDRREIFVTTKVWNADQGYSGTRRAFEASLKRLDLDYLDLYLIHWPVKDKYKETWNAMQDLYKEGLVKTIGVSNFMQHHLEYLMRDCEIVPMINQVEFHPRLVQQDLLDYCHRHQIRYQAWSPLMRGDIFDIDELQEIAEKHNKTAAQIVLRWNLQKGVVTIPKSVHKDRIAENADLFDFGLSPEDLAKIDSLDSGRRTGPDPDNFNF